MSRGCYVCDSPELIEGFDPRNPVCPDHVVARQHVIGMFNGRIACSCGWQLLGDYLPNERDRLCRIHWVTVCNGAELAEGTS